MSITIGGTIILRAGKIVPEAIAELSTDPAQAFPARHPLRNAERSG
jgi:hypothetical protein